MLVQFKLRGVLVGVRVFVKRTYEVGLVQGTVRVIYDMQGHIPLITVHYITAVYLLIYNKGIRAGYPNRIEVDLLKFWLVFACIFICITL